MSKIIIGFSRRKGFVPLSWLIMLCEGTNFSHTYIKIKSESLDRNLIYQATASGVHFLGEQLFNSLVNVVEEYEISISETSKKRLLQWSIDNLGKPYGYLQLLGIGCIRILKLFGIRINNPFSNDNKAYVCCELVAAALEELGINFSENLDQVDLTAVREKVISYGNS